MKKTTAIILSQLSLVLALGTAGVANAEEIDANNTGLSEAQEINLHQLELEQALVVRADQRRLAQEESPTARFIGFKKFIK